MSKMNARRKIFVVLMVLWMAGIFVFSSRTGGESTEDSYYVGHLVGEIFVPGFDGWSEEEQMDFAKAIDHPLRKTAHAGEYAILALLAAGACIAESRRNIRNEILLPWLTASIYAASDEFHQLFVPGRSGQISDVILDSAGALAGVLTLAAIRNIIMKYKKRCRLADASRED